MKHFIITLACAFVLTMQTGVMAKGQWIYPYAHPTVTVSMPQDEC